jgi:hypothetical protein
MVRVRFRAQLRPYFGSARRRTGGARLCGENESDQGLRPPKGCTWGTPQAYLAVRVTGG